MSVTTNPALTGEANTSGSGNAITAADGAITGIGSLNDSAVTNPAAASADMLQLLRGLLSVMQANPTAGTPVYLTDSVIGVVVTLKGANTEAISTDSAVVVAQRKGSKTVTQVTAPTTAGGIVVLAANAARKAAIIKNTGTTPVFLGASTAVTLANGYKLDVGESLMDEISTDAWWAIAQTASAVLTVIEVA